MAGSHDLKNYLEREPDADLLKKLVRASWVVSVLVFSLVVVMGRYKLDIGMELPMLPPLHAILNTLVAVCLVVAVAAVKKKNITLHRRAIGIAVGFSVLFLLSYVAYHGTQQEVRHGGEGAVRIIYLCILASHIILAAVSLPFILITLSLAVTNHFERHRKMARWVFPIWLYVAATGPVCYLMLRPYY
jgi:putative membrane protein